MKTLILLFLAVLPVLVIGYYIYSKDQDKEPKKLLLGLFLLGFVSAFITVLVTFLLEKTLPLFRVDPENLDAIQLLLYVLIKIALIEEFSKWLMTYLFSYHSKEFDQLYDMIVYAVYVSLGFALLENVLYIFSEGMIELAISRALFAVPGHVCSAVFMGYYLSLTKFCEVHKNPHYATKYIIYSLMIPVFIHTIYDFLLFTGNSYLLLAFLLFIVILYVKSLEKIKAFTFVKINLARSKCPICGKDTVEEDNYCTNCNKSIK